MIVSNYRSLLNFDYFDKLLRLQNVVIFKTTRFFTFLTPQSWYCIENCMQILYRLLSWILRQDDTISRLILLYRAALDWMSVDVNISVIITFLPDYRQGFYRSRKSWKSWIFCCILEILEKCRFFHFFSGISNLFWYNPWKINILKLSNFILY